MQGKVISISHQKGGVGKSSIALNLAVELSRKYTLKVIDLDYQKSLTIFNSIRKDKGLKELEIIHVDSQKELIEIIENNKDLILIDSGGFDSDLNRIAILGADLIITPVSDNLIEIYGLEAFKKILKELREVKNDIKAYILLNKIEPRATKSLIELKNYVKNNSDYFLLLDAVIRRRADISKSFELGQSVVEIDKNSKASKELNRLIDNIEKILK